MGYFANHCCILPLTCRTDKPPCLSSQPEPASQREAPMTRQIPQSNAHTRPSRSQPPATLIGAVLAGTATALLSGCAFEPYPPLPIPPQPQGTNSSRDPSRH